jgi:Helicase associated domain
MTNPRLQALDHLGFEWSPYDAAWNSNFKALIDFKNENGHFVVPVKQKTLHIWIQNQRKRLKDGKRSHRGDGLRKERIAKLESIGVVLL